MRNRWQKLGLLYCPPPNGQHPKLLSHAANPLAVPIKDDIYRIFFSGRDAENRSSVGAVDVDILKQLIVLEHHEPFFKHGPQGSFYSDGVSIGNCYSVDGIQYMLFMGWQTPKSGQWRGDIGRLVVANNLLELTPDPGIPLLASNEVDPLSLSYPWVMKNEAGVYFMWYGSTSTWDAGNGEMLHVFNLATSGDGHRWHREGLAVPFEIGVAQAFSRPSVAYSISSDYEMWFSYRSGSGKTYRIGYATSKNGKAWKLALDESGIDVSTTGWDSEMIEYPFVFDHKGQKYMLYNGNQYGKSGFGLAVLCRE